jgi:hypothetical protein
MKNQICPHCKSSDQTIEKDTKIPKDTNCGFRSGGETGPSIYSHKKEYIYKYYCTRCKNSFNL